MLSNDNDDDGMTWMEESKETRNTPTANKATTQVAFPKPLAQSRSDVPAPDDSKMSEEMANMANKCNSYSLSEVNKEEK